MHKWTPQVPQNASKVRKAGPGGPILVHPCSLLKPGGQFLASLGTLLRTFNHFFCVLCNIHYFYCNLLYFCDCSMNVHYKCTSVHENLLKMHKHAQRNAPGGQKRPILVHPGSFLRSAGPCLASLGAFLCTFKYFFCDFVKYSLFLVQFAVFLLFFHEFSLVVRKTW